MKQMLKYLAVWRKDFFYLATPKSRIYEALPNKFESIVINIPAEFVPDIVIVDVKFQS